MSNALIIRRFPWPVVGALFVVSLAPLDVTAQQLADRPSNTVPESLAATFATDVEGFLDQYCLDCHGAEEPEAALDLSTFHSAQSVLDQFATWNLVRDRVQAAEMPPRDAGAAPTASERTQFLRWLQALREDYIQRHAGDPGEVLVRRLSVSEYDNTIRDLTGVDIRPAAEFPIDPSNEAGFDNSGESLVMTPALLNKYLAAARKVAEHLLFLPDGLAFAPYPVVTETDRDKYCVRRIVDFYERQNTDLADYFFAAWQLRKANLVPKPGVEFPENLEPRRAEANPLSERYLRSLLSLLQSDDHHLGPLRELREAFTALPNDPEAARAKCTKMADRVGELRAALAFEFPHLQVSGINPGSQPLVLWRNHQKATHRTQLNRDALDEAARLTLDHELLETPDRANDLVAAYERFCQIFPDRFYVDRRGREYIGADPNQQNNEGNYRLLSAGFHSMMGYFRDDIPLCELVLTDAENEELNRLWFELELVADVPARQHSGFIWFERAEGRFLVDAEFDDFRSADRNAATEPMVVRLRDAYLAKAERLGADEVELQAMRDHFETTNRRLRDVDASRGSAQDIHVASLPEWAARAYRRPLSDQERVDTIAFYHQLVEQDGLTHEDAVRDVFVSILVSPHFSYRLPNRQGATNVTGQGVRPLDDFELASRLSYFLWSSMPDRELMKRAESGDLMQPDTLRQQVTRMLNDRKSLGLATEFGGQWLGFRQFQTHNSVDRNRFPEFDDALRQSMFEEPLRFTNDVLQNDGSVLDFLYAQHTFVNRELAKHYGIPHEQLNFAVDGWARVADAKAFGRGGLLPMAVFLTQNSPGLRTSPVKRGFWVVRQLLGTHIPAPPPNVPELPQDESQLGELTLRQVLAKHREHESCSGCHEKFDSVGVVFEGYGPIGERRERDLAGNAVQLDAAFPDGTEREGLSGLLSYLREKRQQDFVDTLCRRLLSYGLGRSLILSDEPLVAQLHEELPQHDYAFSRLVEAIVLSPQFLNQRSSTFTGN